MKDEVPKSKFVWIDKLYARTNDNITLDISYAPQNREAVEYIRTDAFIEKLECWINENFYQYTGEFAEGILAQFDRTEDAIDSFRKYMKDG